MHGIYLHISICMYLHIQSAYFYIFLHNCMHLHTESIQVHISAYCSFAHWCMYSAYRMHISAYMMHMSAYNMYMCIFLHSTCTLLPAYICIYFVYKHVWQEYFCT